MAMITMRIGVLWVMKVIMDNDYEDEDGNDNDNDYDDDGGCNAFRTCVRASKLLVCPWHLWSAFSLDSRLAASVGCLGRPLGQRHDPILYSLWLMT